MKTYFAAILFAAAVCLAGCDDPIAQREQNLRNAVDKHNVDQEAWRALGEDSLAHAGELAEGSSYEEAVAHFGFKGDLKMSITTEGTERRGYDWLLDGGVRIRVTFDDDVMTFWSVK